jgi:hypothetical protein
MERIDSLLNKIKALKKQPTINILDIDLMLDYVKVVYADLLDWRNTLPTTATKGLKVDELEINKIEKLTASTPTEFPQTEIDQMSISFQEPTLEELTQAFEKENNDVEDIASEAESISNNHQTDLSTPANSQEEIKISPIERLQEIDTKPVATPPPKPKDDIRKYIGINEKFIFINELFQGNKVAYEEVLSELSFFLNTDDAIEWLQNTVVKPYEWKVDDFTVQDFYRIIDSYYSRIR